MSDEAWFHSADERQAMVEAEQVGAAIDRVGPRYLLRRLAGADDAQHFEDIETLRAEVRARLKQRLAERGEPEQSPPQSEPPPVEQDVFEEDDDDDETPRHPAQRPPVARRRR
jgi:hypothetical protein